MARQQLRRIRHKGALGVAQSATKRKLHCSDVMKRYEVFKATRKPEFHEWTVERVGVVKRIYSGATRLVSTAQQRCLAA